MRHLSPPTAFLALCAFTLAHAQTIGTNKNTNKPGAYTLTAKAQLVVEQVVVRDKKGSFVPNLTASDFTLTEDGTPQKIRFVEHEQMPTDAQPLPTVPGDQEQITIYRRLAHTGIAPEQNQESGKSKYQGHRLIVLYFDMTTMPPDDQQRALFAAQKFIRTQMTAVDLISIMRYTGGSVDVLQDFSADRNKLLSILETLVVGEGQANGVATDDASSADTGTAFGQDDSEFNIFSTDRQLSALQTTAKMLAGMNEKKSLIYFAGGMTLHGVDNQAQLHATVDAAVRAGISFWPVDARGLVATAPLGDATQGSQGNQGMYTSAAAQQLTSDFQQSQDTMYSLAADTGGKALFDSNDLTRGIVQAQHAVTDYYIVGYYTSNTAQNGRFRRIKMRLNNTEASLDYRQGYYAIKEFAHFTEVDKERQLEDALALGNPITDLTISLELNYFQLNRAEYFVPIVVKIPGRELALAKKMGAEHTIIDFVCEIKDDFGGITVTNIRDSVNIRVSDAMAADLAHRPLEYDSGFTLTPGRYTLKFLARDNETGRIGTYQTSFIIPNLNNETIRVPISSVVLSSQRVDTKDALYNVTHGKDAAKNDAANPLVTSQGKLLPSVTRVFSTDRDLYVYLQAYVGASPAPAAATLGQPVGTIPSSPPSPLIAYVSLYHDQKLAFISKNVVATPLSQSRLGITPLAFTLGLGTLAPGRYECQVTVLDIERQRVAFWSGPLMLVR